jgi:hypothetical protein
MHINIFTATAVMLNADNFTKEIIFICITLSVAAIVANHNSKGNSSEEMNALQHLYYDACDAEY